LRLQDFQPLLLHVVGHFVRQRGGGRPGTPAVEEAERLVETDVRDQLERLLEIGFRLAGETDDEVRRQADVGLTARSRRIFCFVLEARVAALHEREDAVQAALHRQVQVVRELRHVGIGVHQRRARTRAGARS
jgi:hypothetical protein